MSNLIEDFSLLVDLKSPDDLAQRPRYHPSLDPKQSTLVEVLAAYYFNEPYPCGLSSCHTPHQKGYLVVTSDDKETNIGGVCGKRIFGDDFVIKANERDRQLALKHQTDTLQAAIENKEQFLAKIADLHNRKKGTRWAQALLARVKDRISRQTSAKLHAMAARDETAVTIEREATKEERDQHSAFNPSTKPLRYKVEKVGDLQGLQFLVIDPHQATLSLKDKFYELERSDINSLSSKQRRDWVSWVNNIELSFDAIEKNLAEALRFFSRENMLLIEQLDDIETERSR